MKSVVIGKIQAGILLAMDWYPTCWNRMVKQRITETNVGAGTLQIRITGIETFEFEGSFKDVYGAATVERGSKRGAKLVFCLNYGMLEDRPAMLKFEMGVSALGGWSGEYQYPHPDGAKLLVGRATAAIVL